MVNNFKDLSGSSYVPLFEKASDVINSICNAHGKTLVGVSVVRSDKSETDHWYDVIVDISGIGSFKWYLKKPTTGDEVIYLLFLMMIDIQDTLSE